MIITPTKVYTWDSAERLKGDPIEGRGRRLVDELIRIEFIGYVDEATYEARVAKLQAYIDDGNARVKR